MDHIYCHFSLFSAAVQADHACAWCCSHTTGPVPSSVEGHRTLCIRLWSSAPCSGRLGITSSGASMQSGCGCLHTSVPSSHCFSCDVHWSLFGDTSAVLVLAEAEGHSQYSTPETSGSTITSSAPGHAQTHTTSSASISSTAAKAIDPSSHSCWWL